MVYQFSIIDLIYSRWKDRYREVKNLNRKTGDYVCYMMFYVIKYVLVLPEPIVTYTLKED